MHALDTLTVARWVEVKHYEALASSQRESGNEATQNDEIKQISCTATGYSDDLLCGLSFCPIKF